MARKYRIRKFKKRKFMRKKFRKFKTKKQFNKKKRGARRSLKSRFYKHSALSNIPFQSRGHMGLNHNVKLMYVHRDRYINNNGGNTPQQGAACEMFGGHWTQIYQSLPQKPRLMAAMNSLADTANDYAHFASVYSVERSNAMTVNVRIEPMTGATYKGVKVYLLPAGHAAQSRQLFYGTQGDWSWPPNIDDIEKHKLYKKMVVIKDVAGPREVELTIKPKDFNPSYNKKDATSFKRCAVDVACDSSMSCQVLIVPIDYMSGYQQAYAPWSVDVRVTVTTYMTFGIRKSMDSTIDSVVIPTETNKPTVVLNTGTAENIFGNSKMDMKLEEG